MAAVSESQVTLDQEDLNLGFDENAEQEAKELANQEQDAERPGVKAATMDQLAQLARVDNLEEIARRKEAKEGRRMVMRDYTRNVGFKPLPNNLRDHPFGFILCVVTGPGYTRPKSANPGVMIIAYFGHDDEKMAVEEAKKYATRIVAPRFNMCDLRLVPIDRWCLVASTPEKMADEKYCMDKMDRNMNLYYDYLRNKQSVFVKKVEKVTGRNIASETKQDSGLETSNPESAALEEKVEDKDPEKEKESRRKELKYALSKKRAEKLSKRLKKEVKEKSTGEEQLAILGLSSQTSNKKVSTRMAIRQKLIEEEGMKSDNWVPPLPGDLLRRSQSYAVVCFLPDLDVDARKGRKDREFMFKILKIYGDTSSAEKDTSENLSVYVVDFDMETVDMGEWLFPENVDSSKIENFKYHDSEQEAIMKNRIFQNKCVRKHEVDCEEKGMKPEELFLKSVQEANGMSVEDYYAQSRIKTVEEAQAIAEKEAALKASKEVVTATTTTSTTVTTQT